MSSGSLLSWIVFTPLLGAVISLFTPDERLVRRVALAVTAVTFALSLLVLQPYVMPSTAQTADGPYGAMHFEQRVPWFASADGAMRVTYHVGVDGLSAPLVVLTTFTTLLACAASWNFSTWQTRRGARGYFSLLLLLETGMLGVFTALDFVLFYVFWELMLLPMYFLIGVWGGPRREYAAIKFFIYTLVGSVVMLVPLLAFYFYAPPDVRTFDLLALATNPAIQSAFRDEMFFGLDFGPVMFLLLFIGLAIKIPAVPLHTWLPDAHVEAPTPISMILAGVLLKTGAYGLLRIAVPILPDAAQTLSAFLGAVGVVSILYGAFCALGQRDFKRLVAYSSVSHMGYVVLGIASLTPAGWSGALFQMIAHGISSPMCFFLVGVIYDRAHHRELDRFGGLWLSMPRYGGLATIGFFAALGLPGLCGFIGEVLAILGAFQSQSLAARGVATLFGVLAASGAILTAAYVLWMMHRVFLGKERPEYNGFADCSARETAILAPLAALCVLLGVLPQLVLSVMSGTVSRILDLTAPLAR